MKAVIIGFHDKVANQFQGLTMDVNDDVAIRNFAFSVNNSPELLFKAKDLELFKLGVIDTDTGIMELIVPMVHLCFASDLIGVNKE